MSDLVIARPNPAPVRSLRRIGARPCWNPLARIADLESHIGHSHGTQAQNACSGESDCGDVCCRKHVLVCLHSFKNRNVRYRTWRPVMTEYLCIFVDAAGRPAGGKWFAAPSDTAATVRAQELAHERLVDGYVLWHGFAEVASSGTRLLL